MNDRPPLPPLRRFNERFVPAPAATHVKGLQRVPTPNTDRSHLGDLILGAGVLPPQPTVSSSVSPWTSGANRTTLAVFLMSDETNNNTLSSSAPLPRQPPKLKTYLTGMNASPLRNAKQTVVLEPITTIGDHLIGEGSSLDVQNAIFKLQDTVRRVQLLAGNKSASDALEQSMLRHNKEMTQEGNTDPSKMSKAELWRYRHSQLPAGTQTPTFDNEEQLRYVPSTYIDKRIYDIRLDPQRWFELKERVQELKNEKREMSFDHDSHPSILARNKLLAHRLTPIVRLEESVKKKAMRASRMEEAKERRKVHEDSKMHPVTQAQRQEERHSRQALQWILLVAWGCRTGRLARLISQRHADSSEVLKHGCIALIQRTVRNKLLRNGKMSQVKAFILRARLLKRLLTRVRARVLRPRYVDVVRKFLQQITFPLRVFLSFRQFHRRVVQAQRLVRRWRAEKRNILELRTLQWNRCADRRLHDMTLMAAKGSSVERDIANRELEDLKGITEAHRAQRLERYRKEAQMQFRDDLAKYWQAKKEIATAPDARTASLLRSKLARVPAIRILIPAEEVERLVRNAIREVRIQRQTNV